MLTQPSGANAPGDCDSGGNRDLADDAGINLELVPWLHFADYTLGLCISHFIPDSTLVTLKIVN